MLTKLPLELLVVVAAFLDLRDRRIPNWLTASGMVAGLAINTYQYGSVGLKNAALGLLVAFAIYTLLFALRAMGGGDVKLMAAVGAFTGAEAWLKIFLITSVVGGVIAIMTLLFRGGWKGTARNIGMILKNLGQFRAPHLEHPELDISHPKASTLPHGASIALGVLIYEITSSF